VIIKLFLGLLGRLWRSFGGGWPNCIYGSNHSRRGRGGTAFSRWIM